MSSNYQGFYGTPTSNDISQSLTAAARKSSTKKSVSNVDNRRLSMYTRKQLRSYSEEMAEMVKFSKKIESDRQLISEYFQPISVFPIKANKNGYFVPDSSSESIAVSRLINGFNDIEALMFYMGQTATPSAVDRLTGGLLSRQLYRSSVMGYKAKKPISVKFLLQLVQSMGFKYYTGDGFAVKFDDLNRPIECIGLKEGVFGDAMLTNLKDFEALARCMDKHFHKDPGEATITTIVSIDDGNLNTTTEQLTPRNVFMASDCFYPWMGEMTIAQYFKEFMESGSNVIVLYGDPGTGKSSMIQTGLVQNKLQALITSNAEIISNPTFLTTLAAKLAADSGRYDLIILEDADALMRPRAKGNLQLSSVLNSTSGIGTKNQFKLILTTNAKDLSGIDPALLRHGRCFDIMKFGKLTPAQANAARISQGMDHIRITHPMTLGRAMNYQPAMKSSADEDVTVVAPRFPLPDTM